jgi:hypothetical protein
LGREGVWRERARPHARPGRECKPEPRQGADLPRAPPVLVPDDLDLLEWGYVKNLSLVRSCWRSAKCGFVAVECPTPSRRSGPMLRTLTPGRTELRAWSETYSSKTSISTFFLTKGVILPLNVVALTWASSMKWYSVYGGSFLGLFMISWW